MLQIFTINSVQIRPWS